MMHTDIWRAIDTMAQRQAKARTEHTKDNQTKDRKLAQHAKNNKKQ